MVESPHYFARVLRSAGIAATLCFLVLTGGCEKQEAERVEPVRPVKAMKVGELETLDNSYVPGKARAAQEVDLSFRVGGPLIERPVNVGDQVAQGDLIARIDPRDYEVELRNTQGRLDNQKAELRRAISEYQRELRIFKEDPGATSEVAVVRKREAQDKARAGIASLEAEVDASRDRLDYTNLRAPFDGTITKTYVENFQTVQPNEQIARLLDNRQIKFDMDLPEKWISFVPYIEKVEVIYDAFPNRSIPAEIFEVSKEASQTTRTYRVTLMMEQPEGVRILAGMAGRATGELNLPKEMVEQEGLTVPPSAVFSPDTGEASYVWVVDEQSNTVHRREVEAMTLSDSGVVVEQGLKPGEWVVTAGVNYLKEGQEVRILEGRGE
ncbi:MAG: efflux RND transporter periplasmic adaptor subunit [Gammaproteobacteria bacterium]|jgi:RND family efflux transporter MFP subunit|nr:efflux RND transporter periplasmic adaptor subunit [Gammaproteobacteria bacterium]